MSLIPGDQSLQDRQRGQGCGGEAHCLQNVRVYRGGEGGVDQEHSVRNYDWWFLRIELFNSSFSGASYSQSISNPSINTVSKKFMCSTH